MSKVKYTDPQFDDPIERLRQLPDKLQLGKTSKIRSAIQEVLDYAESQENQVLLHPKPGDVLLIETDVAYSKEYKKTKEQELTTKIGCQVVILDCGMKAVKQDIPDIESYMDAIYNSIPKFTAKSIKKPD